MKALRLAAPLVIVTLAACAAPMPKPSQEIAAASEAWQQAYNSGDVDGLVALYLDDARILPPNAELGQGHGDIRAAFSEEMKAGLMSELQTLETVESGDIGFRVGVYAMTAPGGAVVDRGKFVETWRKVNGEWKISDDIWNSNMPVAAGETLVITHEVEDGDRWLAAWRGENSRHEYFAANAGVSGIRTFQSPDDPDLTAVVIDVADMAAFEAFMQSEAVAVAKKEDGVKDATLRVFVEAE